MKLEEFVQPVRLSNSCRPTLVRHILSHLLFRVEEANSDRQIKLSIVDFYRPVAVDLLAMYDVTEKSEVHRFAAGIVK